VNNLGTSTSTGALNFTLDVDAPEITSVSPSAGSQHGGTAVTLSGDRLLNSNGSAPTVLVGGAAARVTGATAGPPAQVTLLTPPGAPGQVAVEVITDRGRAVVPNAFTYEADSKTPFTVESDTRLLWHLDEPGNGSVRVTDLAGILHGTTHQNSTYQPGRFAGGRKLAHVSSDADGDGVLNFGTGSFTAEVWFRTEQVGRTYTLIGKDHQDSTSFNYTYVDFALQLLPTGGLRAVASDTGGDQWRAEMSPTSPTAVDVDDNNWHHAALVVDRTNNVMTIYVDGKARASSPWPSAFGTLRNNYTLRVGHFDNYAPSTFGGATEFPGTIDEVRVSSTAHTAEQVQRVYDGTAGGLGLVVHKSSPYTLPRGTTVDLSVAGYNLTHVTAALLDANGTQTPGRVVSSSATSAVIQIPVPATAALGNAQLVLSSGAGAATLQQLVVELGQSVFNPEPDTLVLWHLDETGNGGVRVADAGPLSIDGTAHDLSSAAPGRFGGGRKQAHIFADSDFGLMNFGTGSFTAEVWFRTEQVGRTYTLIGKDHQDSTSFNYTYVDFALQITPSGALRAVASDTGGDQWRAHMSATDYDVDDGQWHLAALVVDRTHDLMSIYVDGRLRASTPRPSAFGTLRNNYSLRVGHFDNYGPSTFGGATEFPGVIDEVRLSSTAHTLERMRQDFDGNGSLLLTSHSPRQVGRKKQLAEAQVTEVTVNGYNLSGITGRVQRNGQLLDVPVVVNSSSYRQAQLSLVVGPSIPLGPAQLVISKEGQTEVTADIYVTEQGELAAEPDTVVLWHLDETGDGPVQVLYGGPVILNGMAHSSSKAAPGRFGGGRKLAHVVSDSDFGLMNFGNGSFTAECWFRTDPVGRTYTLVGKDHQDSTSFNYTYVDFALQLLPSGALRAVASDLGGDQWRA
ncbi:MAG TPA: LamG-like jellyroll fold domain-containing protein, partial [Pyrinomonadaceae bacterium]|nr:LamG-like jellyroll fold domain-containing protein [Pyrinomonadaceae bacterium]